MLFTDEHEELRRSIRAFVEKEITPNIEEWEETTFPDAIVRRMGELGFLGLSVPEKYGGQGGDYFTNLVLAEEMGRSGCGGLLMGLSVHTDMVIPPLLEFGTEEQKQRWVTAGVSGEKISASASPSPTPAPTWPASAPGRCATATSGSSTGRRPTSPTATGRR